MRALTISALALTALALCGCSAPAIMATAEDCGEVTSDTAISFVDFAACAGDAYNATAGFASTSTAQGMSTTAYRNPAEREVLLNLSVGNLMAIGDDTYVQPMGGAWVVADTASPDATIAGLSAAAAQLVDLDITGIAPGTTGELRVTGTDELLGEPVFVLTGDQVSQGITTASTFSVTKDWEVLGSTNSAALDGSELTTVTEVTEWDVKQDITPPQ